MTSSSYYTNRIVKGYISHDDDEAYALGDFPYAVLLEIDITDTIDLGDGEVYLIITNDLEKMFLKFVFPDDPDISGYQKVFGVGCNCKAARREKLPVWRCPVHGQQL